MEEPLERNCRICETPSPVFHQDSRIFHRCPECSLLFTEQRLDEEGQRKHYQGQVETVAEGFWESQVNELFNVINRYHPPRRILDFGAGSGNITREFQRRGYDCTALEPMVNGYLKDQRYPEPFDVIVSIEVVEHLMDLRDELQVLRQNLAPDGIMLFTTLLTNRFIDLPDAQEHFSKWWYKDDLTHVSFFCTNSLAKLAEIGDYSTDIYGNQAFVLYQ